MNLKSLYTNEVTMLGVVTTPPSISHNYDGENYYSLRLKVPKAYYNSDIIHMFISEKNLIQGSTLIDKGMALRIQGKIIQSELMDQRDISVLGEVVELLESIEGLDTENRITLGGVVQKNFPIKSFDNANKKLKYFVLKNIDEEDKNAVFAKINCWNYNATDVDSRIQEGSKVLIKGSIISYKKTADAKNGKKELTYHEIEASIVLNISEDEDNTKES